MALSVAGKVALFVTGETMALLVLGVFEVICAAETGLGFLLLAIGSPSSASVHSVGVLGQFNSKDMSPLADGHSS